MKFICVLLGVISVSSNIFVEAAGISLQPIQDGTWQPSDYRGIDTYTIRSDVELEESMACEKKVPGDGTIKSPTYPVPVSSQCKIFKWHVKVKGYNVNVTIDYLDLDAAAGDYLFISPGHTLLKDGSSIVITSPLETPKKLQVMHHSEMLVFLVTQDRSTSGNTGTKYKGFQLSYEAEGVLTTEAPSTTPRPSLPMAPLSVEDDIIVYVKNITPVDMYTKKLMSFKGSIVDMAKIVCTKHNVTCSEPNENIQITTENVQIPLITECPRSWPDWEHCTEVNMSVPIYASEDNNKTYELTREHLQLMWSLYGNQELKDGMQVYQVPDSEETLRLWLYITVGVAALFSLIMVLVWRFDLFNVNPKRNHPSSFDIFERDSIASTNSWISNSYQEVPPMVDFQCDEVCSKEPPSPEKPNFMPIPTTTFARKEDLPKTSDGFVGAFYFGTLGGYNNPTFDNSEEINPPKKEEKDSSSDDDSSSDEDTARDGKSKHGHLYEAPKQVTFEDKNESAL